MHLLVFKVTFAIVCVCVCVCAVAQLCLTLCDLMDCSPPGSSVHQISQAGIPEWDAISFYKQLNSSLFVWQLIAFFLLDNIFKRCLHSCHLTTLLLLNTQIQVILICSVGRSRQQLGVTFNQCNRIGRNQHIWLIRHKRIV